MVLSSVFLHYRSRGIASGFSCQPDVNFSEEKIIIAVSIGSSTFCNVQKWDPHHFLLIAVIYLVFDLPIRNPIPRYFVYNAVLEHRLVPTQISEFISILIHFSKSVISHHLLPILVIFADFHIQFA